MSTTAHSRPPPRLSVRFLTSADTLARCPADSTLEVAFAGRSNAGKSSVLNCLTGSRQTARVSKTPGRTQLINLFDVPDPGHPDSLLGRLVDLPGYGYAKASKSAQRTWQAAVNEYLSFRENLAAVVLVTDIRHPGQTYDDELIDWSSQSEVPLRVLLNKSDKLKRGAAGNALQGYRKRLANAPLASAQLFSATAGTGREDLHAWLLTEFSAER